MKGYSLGCYIKLLREEQGISCEELCRGLCNRSTLYRIESGEQQPSLFVASQLLQRLGMDEGVPMLALGHRILKSPICKRKSFRSTHKADLPKHWKKLPGWKT